MKTILLLLAILLSACGTVPGGVDYSKMTPEAIKALTSDKSLTAACTVANSVYGRVVTTYMVLDKSTIINGGVSVNSDCVVSVTNAPKPATAASAP